MVQEMVYFQGTRTSPTRISDSEGLIGTFVNQGGDIERLGDGSLVRKDNQVWIMAIPKTDEARIKRVQNYPGFGKIFKQVSHIPKTGETGQNIHQGIGNLDKVKADAKLEVEEAAKLKVKKFQRYYQLESKLLKKDGTPVKGVNEDELTELNSLKTELEI